MPSDQNSEDMDLGISSGTYGFCFHYFDWTTLGGVRGSAPALILHASGCTVHTCVAYYFPNAKRGYMYYTPVFSISTGPHTAEVHMHLPQNGSKPGFEGHLIAASIYDKYLVCPSI